jgi:hypothetical protein
MKHLIAISSVLLNNRDYKPGDELPTYDPGLVEAWIVNGAAVWNEDKEEKERTVKAKPATAPAGRAGIACPSAGSDQDLVGKPPSRKRRGAQPEPDGKGKKSNA